MSKLLAVLFLYVCMFGFSLMNMCWGWGLEIKSLGWMLCGWVGIIVCAGLCHVVGAEN